MPRTVEITVPPARTADVLAPLHALEGVVSVRVQHGISVKPPGDVVVATVTDRALPGLMRALENAGVLRDPGSGVVTTRPQSVVSRTSHDAILCDASRASWEEIDNTINRQSTMTLPTLVGMALVGLIAAAGILTDALHLVIGAVAIAPAFEPLSRMALGVTGGTAGVFRRGLVHTAKGYAALLAGAIVATLLLQFVFDPAASTRSGYLVDGALLTYWTSVTAASLLVSAAAGFAGALLLITLRSVLTLGVVIVLALVPATVLTGIGLAVGDFSLAAFGAARLAIEMGIVLGTSFIVFTAVRTTVRPRSTSM